MDWKQLPYVDGYEATKAIKQINTHIPVIAQTAFAMLSDREKALGAGCDDYIRKPINFIILKNLGRKYLSDKDFIGSILFKTKLFPQQSIVIDFFIKYI